MININRVVITGHLTRDPKSTELPSGTSVCELRIGCNTRRKDQSTGEWGDKPNYLTVKVWGGQAESATQYLSKGSGVAIDGRLDWREWQASDGANQQTLEIIADVVQFLPDGKGATDDDGSDPEPAGAEGEENAGV